MKYLQIYQDNGSPTESSWRRSICKAEIILAILILWPNREQNISFLSDLTIIVGYCVRGVNSAVVSFS